jgi:DMSO/TMAO reductase YedYZ molybdopterin-dependent catalytic subunit
VKLDRRSFIKLIPAVAVAVAGGSWWFLTQTTRESVMTSPATGTSSVTSQAATATTSAALQTESTTSVVPQPTSTNPEPFDFPVTWNGEQPTKVDTNEYRLRIDGDVSNPLELTIEDLYAMSNVQKTLKIGCVMGWAVDVPWEGIPLSHLLTQAGASLKNIDHVTVKGVTGYETTLSSDEVANSDNMIALKAGGAPLTIEHGYPARLVMPARFGLDWVKYAARITCANKVSRSSPVGP